MAPKLHNSNAWALSDSLHTALPSSVPYCCLSHYAKHFQYFTIRCYSLLAGFYKSAYCKLAVPLSTSNKSAVQTDKKRFPDRQGGRVHHLVTFEAGLGYSSCYTVIFKAFSQWKLVGVASGTNGPRPMIKQKPTHLTQVVRHKWMIQNKKVYAAHANV